MTSAVYDDGTRIGIGTPNPQAKLDVNGSLRSSGLLSCDKVSTNIFGDLFCATDRDSMSSLTGTGPITYSSGTTSIGITQASSTTNGYLSSTDWNTFNNKQAAITAGTNA